MAQITLQDVANQAGVSIKTVSRVLNNEPYVAPKTAERIRAVIAELNYVPNIPARNLSRGKARAIGLVVGWPVSTPFTSALIEAVLRTSMRKGYSLALFTLEENVASQIIGAFVGKQIDGIILDTIAAENAEITNQLNTHNIPCTIIHPNKPYQHFKAATVAIDNSASARQAAEYLISIGHRHIGCVIYDGGLRMGMERMEGYAQALQAAGIPFREEYVRCGDGVPNAGGVNSTFNLFSQDGVDATVNLLSEHKEITAIFAFSDIMALGVLRGIWQLGLRVPDDITVVGFDDITYASMLVPPLTTVRQPIEEICDAAVTKLIELIDNPNTPTDDVVLTTTLVVRASSKAHGNSNGNGTHN